MIRIISFSLVGFLVFVGILFAIGGAVISRALPPEKIAAMVKENVHKSTGGELAFDPGVDLALWPDISAEVKNVVYKSPDGGSTVSFDRMRLSVALLPLMSREIVVKEFLLDGPALRGKLEGNRFTVGEVVRTEPKKPEAAPAAKTVSGEKPYTFKFEKVAVTNGRLLAANQQDRVFLGNIALGIKMPGGEKGRLDVSGGATYRGKKIAVAFTLDKPLDLVNGKSSPGQFSLSVDGASLKGDGKLSKQGVFLDGSLSAEVASLTDLLTWIEGLSPGKLPFEKLSFSSAAQVSGSDVILKGASLKLDNIASKGDVHLSLGDKPDVFARLTLDKIDLDRFTGGASAPAANGSAAPAPQQGWSTAPIDFSLLNALNADVQVKTQGFSLKGVDVGPSTLTAELKGGVLKASSSEASLFGGKFASNVLVNAATPSLSIGFGMAGVQAQPVLAAFAGFKKLSGTVAANVSATGTGKSQAAIVSSLSGKGNATFSNGVLEGIDLLKISELLQSRAQDIALGAESRTPFTSLGGTFTIAQGVAVTNDLKMQSQVMSATGNGNISLPGKSLAFKITPALLTASAKQDSARSLAIPVNIKGPFSGIKVQPDYAGMIQNAINDPTAVRDTIRNLKGNLKDNLKDIKSNFKQDPAAALQNLLGGGAAQPQPQAAPAQ